MTDLQDPIALSAAKQRLKTTFLESLNQLKSGPEGQQEKFLRFSIPVEDVNAMAWLACQSDPIKTYWANRNREFKMAGVGAADLVSGASCPGLNQIFDRLSKYLSPQHPNLHYYGGFQFNMGEPVQEEWNSFGAYRFLIPQFEVYRSQTGTYFTCNFVYDPQHPENETKLLSALEDIQFDLTYVDWEALATLHRTNIPDKATWKTIVEQALEEMRENRYEKIVLARKAMLEFSEPLNPVAYLLRLRRMSEETFNYYFQTDTDHAFLGATPERLFRRKGRNLDTEAIAGTRPRGATLRKDKTLARELLESDKEVREHGYVVNMIQNILMKYATELSVDEDTQITQLAHVQHLCKHFSARLKADVRDAELLEDLHPTPALGGFPTKEALEGIKRLEPFDRGWYAAPIGFVGYDHTEFVVAIRSALVEREHVYLYSGAGIVRGSDPEEEWQEIEDKIGKFLKALEL